MIHYGEVYPMGCVSGVLGVLSGRVCGLWCV